MPKGKLFLIAIVSLALIAAGTALAVQKQVGIDPATGERVLMNPVTNHASHSAGRDDNDKYDTYRYRYSTDGGETWSDIKGIGDTGMWTVDPVSGDTVSAWSVTDPDGFSPRYGIVVDNSNYLHIATVLNAYSDVPALNPLGRSNGVYDVKADPEGDATYTLIAAEAAGTQFCWADIGKDADGNLYAIWVAAVNDGATAEVWGARTTDGAWGAPAQLLTGLDPTKAYVHMTEHVGAYFYFIYEIYNEGTTLYDQYVAKVSSDLSQISHDPTGSSIATANYISYYVGSANAIDQDVAAGYIYFGHRNQTTAADLTGVAVGNSQDGVNWIVETVLGPQRYPSIGLDMGHQTPYVFSNRGLPASQSFHRNWYSYDESGYNGGGWTEQILADGVLYDGVRSLLYCHNGVWTPSGTFIRGCNVWGQFTPEGYQISYLDGETWSEPKTIWSIFGDENTFKGGYAHDQGQIVAGNGNSVFVVWDGIFGATDFNGPSAIISNISSFMLADPRIVTATYDDETGTDSTDTYGVYFNWHRMADDYEWEYALPDSFDVNANGNGSYFFHLPDSVHYFMIDTSATPDDTTDRYDQLVAGDQVEFYVDGYDVLKNYASGSSGVWVVNQSIVVSAPRDDRVPTKFALDQNYPNPFNSRTMIPFSVNKSTEVNLAVYDINGRLVNTIYQGKVGAGSHLMEWNAEGVPSGIYFYRLEAAGVTQVAKMSLIR